ncbi:glucokinase [Paraburkholderia sp. WC7.3g]|uniref:ROK family glucokinase n=1 Tax=Paraburkholderia sp. WC7.3g TaxID=2991070 RepID=UPI003D1E7BFF
MVNLGIDIGGTKIAAGVVDEQGRVLARSRRQTPTVNPTDIDLAIADLYHELSQSYPIKDIGVAAAGFVSSDRSTILTAPNLPWRDYPLGRRVAARLPVGCAVVVENDANAAAWGEHVFGLGRGGSVSLMVTIGTGIGGGIISNGDLQRGAFGAAAEVGHMTVVQDGLRCGCGNLGCWEAYGSGTALVAHAERALLDRPGQGAALRRIRAAAGVLTGPDIAAAAAQGDPLSIELFHTLGDWIGRGLASLTALIDPDVIIVGGGVADSDELLMPSIRRAYSARLTGGQHRPHASIVAASLGNDAGLVGVASLAGMRRTGAI